MEQNMEKRLRIYPWLFITVYILVYIFWILTGTGMFDRNGNYIGYDFLCFYTAATKALAGDVSEIYDIYKFKEFELQIIGNVEYDIFLPWLYPPHFLMFISPLALLPYLPSLFLWLAATLAGYVAVVRKIAPHPYTYGFVLAFPSTLINFGYAQNGFLSAILLGAGLLLLAKRPIVAGILLGFLTYKPQLALLIAVALIFARMWRAFATACITFLVLVIVSWTLFGAECWQAFYNNLPVAQFVMNSDNGMWEKMQSVFALARLMGMKLPYAYGLQTVFSIAAVVVVAWVWYQRVFPMAYVILTAAMFLATPYAMTYDLTIMGLTIAWYGWHCFQHGWLPGEKLILVLAWLTPLFSSMIARISNVQIIPLILLSIIILAVRRVKLESIKD